MQIRGVAAAKLKDSCPIRFLREKKGFSQKELAEKMEMDRSRLVRLEQKRWDELSLGDMIHLSKALGMNLSEMLAYYHDAAQAGCLERASLQKPHFRLESGQGYFFDSLLKHPQASFIGSLRLAPKTSLTQDQSPQAGLLFYLVLEGELLMISGGREHCLKEKECFTLHGPIAYELYNPHAVRDAVALVVTVPSFVRNL